MVLDAMKIDHQVPFRVFDRLPEASAEPWTGGRLEWIRASGVLRVGFNRNAIPFAFFNDTGDLVGFDIAMADKLGADLGCREIQFYPVDYDRLPEVLNGDLVDIVMSEVSISAERLGKIGLTDSYMELSMALLVPDFRKKELREHPELLMSPEFSVAALQGADYDRLAKFDFPGKAVKLEDYDDFFSGRVKADALLIAAENGSAMTIMHPKYDLYILHRQFKDLLAYAVPAGDTRFLEYLNFWLTLRRGNGDIDQAYDYWIRGINVEKVPPRWSVLNNVLLKHPIAPPPAAAPSN